MNHAASPAVMARAIRYGAWPNVNIEPTVIEQVYLHQDCLPCLLGKMNRLPRSEGSGVKPNLGEAVSVDYVPVSVMSLGGFTGFYMFVEVTVGFKYAVLTKAHNADILLSAIKLYMAYIHKYGHVLRFLRPDAGTVEKDIAMCTELALLGVTTDPAAPESQFQNDVERSVQTVVKGVGAVLARQLFLSNIFWHLALIAFIHASNCCPNTLSDDYSPWYHITHKHPNIPKWFKFYFGQPVVSVVLRQHKGSFKFAPHSEFGYAVGSSLGSNGATLVYIPSRGTDAVYERYDVRHVKLHAGRYPRTHQEYTALLPTVGNDGVVTFPSIPPIQSDIDFSIVSPPTTTILQPHDASVPNNMYKVRDITTTDGSKWTLYTAPEAVSAIPSTLVPPTSTSSTALPVPSPIYTDEVTHTQPSEGAEFADGRISSRLRSTDSTINAVRSEQADPNDMPTLKAAHNGDEWDTVWQPACNKEFTTIDEFGVKDTIAFEDIPKDEPIWPTKMVLKKKRDSTGMFTGAKARLCVIGNWITGVYQSLFAPTVNEKSLKLLFAIAIIFGLCISGIDVKGAFLYPDLPKPVYVSIPPILTGGQPTYWKLNKTLYGLPISPQAFYKHISAHLLNHGYQRTTADPCMFFKRDGDKFIMFVVHVDDFAIASSHQEMTDELLRVMQLQYTITPFDTLESFLGIHIVYRPDGSVVFTQPRRIQELVDKYNLSTAPSVQVPMSSLFSDAYQDDSPQCDHHEFMSLLGSLIFLIKTRPDIAYAVNRMATRTGHATVKDFNALLRIVSYLNATKHLGIRFKSKVDAAAATRLYCWVDAAYAGHPDSKSHTGYCFSLGDPFNGMFYSRSFKQSNVTLSSTESENSAAVEAVKEIMWFRQLLKDLGFPQVEPTLMFTDNASMITLANDYSGNHKRVKHYLTRINFMIDQVRLGIVTLEHVSTSINVADMLTKPLGPIDFLRLRPHLLGEDI
jgi:hypothetical protein